MLSMYLTWIRYKSSTKSRTCHSVTYFSWLKSKQKVPALAKTVILRFAHKSQATFLGHAKFASNNFSFKHRGQKNSLFTHKQQHTMHRSNSICPISAVWTVVCCVFDSAGVFWNYLCWWKCSLNFIERKITPPPPTLQVSHLSISRPTSYTKAKQKAEIVF